MKLSVLGKPVDGRRSGCFPRFMLRTIVLFLIVIALVIYWPYFIYSPMESESGSKNEPYSEKEAYKANLRRRNKPKPTRPHPVFTSWEEGPEYERFISEIRPWVPPASAGLDQISADRKNWSIVFFRVSSEPLEPFELCCFHSAALHNPSATVKILIANTSALTLPSDFLPNVHFEVMDYETVFRDTPLESWYSEREWNRAPDPLSRIRHVANAARHAYVWKTGCVYLDTDMITIRPLGGLRNSLAFQCTDNSLRNKAGKRDALAANGAFLSFDPGHPYMEMVMNVTRDTFRREVKEGHYGPKMLTRMIPVYELRKASEHPEWPELRVLPHEYIYPFRFTEQGELYGRMRRRPQLERYLDSAFTVHLWRNGQRRKSNPHLWTQPGTVLAKLIDEHCPAYKQSLVHPRFTAL